MVAEGGKQSKKKTVDISRLWGPKHQAALDVLKMAALTTAPVLGYADSSEPFILTPDASHHGLSAILSQDQDGALAFASRRLHPTEKNEANGSMKLEFLAMKWDITEKLWHYLLEANFVVRIILFRGSRTLHLFQRHQHPQSHELSLISKERNPSSSECTRHTHPHTHDHYIEMDCVHFPEEF